jgi:hypothetical protein
MGYARFHPLKNLVIWTMIVIVIASKGFLAKIANLVLVAIVRMQGCAFLIIILFQLNMDLKVFVNAITVVMERIVRLILVIMQYALTTGFVQQFNIRIQIPIFYIHIIASVLMDISAVHVNSIQHHFLAIFRFKIISY